MKTQLILVTLLISFSVSSQNNKFSLKIKTEVEEMINAIKNQNYKVILQYTYPTLVEMIGNEKEALDKITEGMKSLKSRGFEIEKIEIGEPGEIFIAGNEFHCLVPEKIFLNSKDGHFLKNGNLLAVSKDKGQSWYYIDCNIGKKRLLIILPEYNSSLIIPKSDNITKIQD